MFDFNWRRAYEEWEPDEINESREQAFRPDWFGAMAQIIAMLEDERQEAASTEEK